MITELKEVDPEITGGHYIDVVNNNIRNARLNAAVHLGN